MKMDNILIFTVRYTYIKTIITQNGFGSPQIIYVKCLGLSWGSEGWCQPMFYSSNN